MIAAMRGLFDNGARLLELNVAEDNMPARALYDRLGLRVQLRQVDCIPPVGLDPITRLARDQ